MVDTARLLTATRALLGGEIGFGGVRVRITEVEAYAGSADPGSHAYRGRTPRTAAMFGPPGHAYVYFTYGMHFCLNLVLSQDGSPAAALIRAGEVVAGIEIARSRRGAASDRDLARGPARLTQAMGITLDQNGVPVAARPGLGGLTLTGTGRTDPAVVANGPRVGVRGPGGDAAEFPWRFWLDGDPYVSAYRPAATRPGR